MVAEAVREAPEETQVPQPEEQTPSPPAPEPVETPQAEQPDAEPSLDAAHDEFLARIGAAEETPDGTDPERKPLSPEAQAEVDRALAEERKAQERTAQQLGVLNAFRDSATNLRNWAATKGLQQTDVNTLVEFFNQYHNTSGQIHRTEASEAAAVETVSQFYEAMAKELPANKRQAFLNARGTEHKGQPDTVKAFLSMAREGYLSKQDANKLVATKLDEYKAFLIEKKLLKGHDAPPAEGSSAASSADDDAKLADPNTPIEVVMAIRERQRRAGG